MQQIVIMNKILQKYIPGQVGRYNDDFMPTSLGDNIQKWGTGAILIESGGYKNDPEKQYIRKLNFIAILSALYSIAKEQENIDYKEYFSIPENSSYKLFDLLIRNAKVKSNKHNYLIDIGIRRREIDNKTHSGFSINSIIANIGDMSFKYGYEEINAEGLNIKNGKIYEKKIKSKKQLSKLDKNQLLEKGYIYLYVSSKLLKKDIEKKPFILTAKPEKISGNIKYSITFDLSQFLSSKNTIPHYATTHFLFHIYWSAQQTSLVCFNKKGGDASGCINCIP